VALLVENEKYLPLLPDPAASGEARESLEAFRLRLVGFARGELRVERPRRWWRRPTHEVARSERRMSGEQVTHLEDVVERLQTA
jgi:hypothetical protein